MSFDNLFSNATRLPSIPKIIQELIQSFDDPDADMDAISSKIAQEPVLTTKLLRVANSAHHGLPKQVSSVQDAAIIMGFPAVRTLVLASGMVDSLKMPAALQQKLYWGYAFKVAGCAKWLCKFDSNVDANTAFTAGLIHSIGQLLMYSAEPEKAETVNDKVSHGSDRLIAEQETFGYNHATVGAELAKRWKFPDDINIGLAFQNTPKEATPNSDIAAVIYLAKHIVNMHEDKPSSDDIIKSLPQELIDTPPINLKKMSEALSDVEDFSGGMNSLLEN